MAEIGAGPPPKRPWTECITCINRRDCDWCPFVLNRTATPLGAEHEWPLDRTVDKDGNVDRPGLLDAFTAPPHNECPYGVSFAGARKLREGRLLENFARGVITEADALAAATAMGVSLDAEER